MPPRRSHRSRRVLMGAAAFALALVAGTASTSVADTETELEKARSRLAGYEQYFSSVLEQSSHAQAELAEAQQTFADIELRVRATASDLLANRESAVMQARRLYMGGSLDALEALLGSQSLSEVEAQLTYLQYSGEQQTILFEELQVRRARLERELQQLEATRSAAQEVAARLAALAAEVSAEVNQMEAEVAALGAELQSELDAVREVAAAAQTSAAPSAAEVPGPPYNADWDAIAQCESGGNWHLDGTYDGGLQFHPDTWLAYGGGQYAKYAWQATREQQIAIGEKVLAGQGPGAWPHCFQE